MKLPPSWNLRTLGELSKYTTVGFVGSMSHLFVESGVPVLRGTNVLAGDLNLNDLKFIEAATHRKWSKSALQAGDIVMVRVGYPGAAALVPAELVPSNAASLVIARPDPAVVDPRFCVHFINSAMGRTLVQAGLVGGAQQVFNTALAGQLSLPVPPLEEQRLIADALDAVDALIKSLERLIAKKSDIKQGLMQALLTGQSRLQGFAAAWREFPVSELADIDPESVPGDTPKSEMITYISLEGASRGQLLTTQQLSFGEAPSRARRRVRTGDLLFGTVRPSLQSHVLLTTPLHNPVASTGFAVLRPRAGLTSSAFLFEKIMSAEVTQQIERLVAGSNYPAVTSRDVGNLVLLMPGFEEQLAIAQVLAAAQAEIQGLIGQLEKTQLVKQGMVQELLTGQTRLVNEGALV